MEDKIITIVFGSLGATLALVGILFAYLQLRGSRQRTTTPDEERVAPPAVIAQEHPAINPLAAVVQEKSVTSPPAAVAQDGSAASPLAMMAREEPVTNPPAAVVQEGPVTSPPAVVLIEEPAASPPYAPSLAPQRHDRADNVTDATPKTDMVCDQLPTAVYMVRPILQHHGGS
jgi:hypothetical protein